MLFLQFAKRPAKNTTDSLGFAHEVALLDFFEDLNGSGGGHRVSTEGSAEPTNVASVHDVCTTGDGRDDESATNTLGGGHEVGNETEMLRSVIRTCSHDARLNLVGNIDDSVVVAPFLQCGEVAIRRNDEPAFTLNGFDNETGQIGCASALIEPRDGASSRFCAR